MNIQTFEKLDMWAAKNGKSMFFTIGRLCKNEDELRTHVFVAGKTGGIPADVIAGYEFQRAVESAR